MPTFRHWTYAERIPSILEHGLHTTDANLAIAGRDALTDVVWLLPPDVDPGAGDQHGLSGGKRTGWVDVDVPAIRWRDWEPQTRMDPEWREILIRAGGGDEAADQWYVFPARIRPSRIVGHGTT